ncbi:MAG: LacI family DNA-binding transcriptional regulator [Bacillota bacterium]
MKITIEDVAQKANVSISTVSQVFNDKGRISEKTKNKVLKVAEKMGYEPRQYNKKISMENIAVIIHEERCQENNLSSFYNKILKGMELELKKENYQIIIKSLVGVKKEDRKMINNIIQDESFKGVVITGYEIDPELISRIRNSSLSILLLDNDYLAGELDCVLNDNFKGAYQITKHIIELGHKDIAFVGGPLNHVSLYKRFNGYSYALKKAGLDKEKNYFFGEEHFNWEGGYEIARKIFSENKTRISAVFAANDNTALGVLKSVLEMGYSVPEDIAIAGFDDILMAKYSHPTLTTVKIFKEKMGKIAGQKLLQLLNNKNKQETNIMQPKTVLPVELKIRESTRGRVDNLEASIKN